MANAGNDWQQRADDAEDILALLSPAAGLSCYGKNACASLPCASEEDVKFQEHIILAVCEL